MDKITWCKNIVFIAVNVIPPHSTLVIVAETGDDSAKVDLDASMTLSSLINKVCASVDSAMEKGGIKYIQVFAGSDILLYTGEELFFFHSDAEVLTLP